MKLSPTAILTFLKSPYDWYRYYILGEPMPDSEYTVAGSIIHKFLEEFFSSQPLKNETIKEFATRRFKELWFKIDWTRFNELKDKLSKTEIKKWLYGYIKSWVDETERLEQKYGTQKSFNINCPTLKEYKIFDKELNIGGIVDAIFTDDRFTPKSKTLNMIIVDYKTSSKTRTTLPKEYFVQLLIYAYILKKQGNKVDYVCIDYIKYNSRYFLVVTENVYKIIEKFINDVSKEINEVAKYDVEMVKNYKPRTRIDDYL